MPSKLFPYILTELKNRFYKNHHAHFIRTEYWRSITFGFILLLSALVLNFFAWEYATASISNAVTDIILSHTRVYNVDHIFTSGALIFIWYIAFLCIWYPWKTPFILKSIALFVIIRSISISLTHIWPFPTQIAISLSDFLKNFIFTGDLFFSWHTGLPFLLSLIFWKNIVIRIICISTSILFGTIVLLGHLHYTIDVFSAFFITYSIYKMSEYIFQRDYILAKESLD